MPDLVAELSAQAKALPPEDRARLAEERLASLDPREADVDAACRVFPKDLPHSVVYREAADSPIMLAVAPFRRKPAYWRQRK